MKKFLMLFFVMLLCVQMISAFNFDNVKTYDEKTKTITIKNAFGLPLIGDDLITAKLDTPQTNFVHVGYNKVAQFTVNPYTDLNKIIGSFEFYDLNNGGTEIEKQIDIKYLGTEEYFVDDYICSKSLSFPNGTATKEVCSISGSHAETRSAWLDFNGDVTKDQSLTIGLFTNVDWGDHIEWIPTLAGVKITEWADWQNLNVNYSSYQVFNTTGATNFTVPTGVTSVGVLIVGGGGAGGWVEGSVTRYGGGGGAGEVIYNDSYAVIAGNNISVVVGAGGNSVSEAPYNGSQSSFGSLIAVGGGGGGAGSTVAAAVGNGARGGSGGGGGIIDTYGNTTGGTGNATYYGENGAVGDDNNNHGGGGGGATAAGSGSTGGAGVEIWNLTWGVGGDGGSGGSDSQGTSAANSTGNGGKGSVRVSGGALHGGMGGTGVVIVGYDQPTFSVTLNSPSDNPNITNETITFNATINTISGFTAQNGTLSVWYSNGTLFNTVENTTVVANQTTYSLTGFNPTTTYYWNVYGVQGDGAGDNSTFAPANYSINIIKPTFTLCNATYFTPFYNITFQDEGNGTNLTGTLNAATFYVWDAARSNIYNSSYTLTNATANEFYTFCASPNTTLTLDYSIPYAAEGYPQRTSSKQINISNTMTSQTLYLLNSADGIYVTFQVVTGADQPLAGVATNVTYGGDVVGAVVTGSDGGATYWLNPDNIYTANFFLTGYPFYTTTQQFTQTSYTVTLGNTNTTTFYDYQKGINYSILPSPSTYLDNDTSYGFNFTISSSYWALDNYGINLTDEDGNVYGIATDDTGTGGVVNVDLDTLSNDTLIMNVWWQINSTNSTLKYYWYILDVSGNSFSIYHLVTDFITFKDSGDSFGLDDFGVGLLVFAIIVGITGTLKVKMGISNTATIFGLLFALVALFDVSFGLIPNPLDATVDNFATVIMGLIFGGILLREVIQ